MGAKMFLTTQAVVWIGEWCGKAFCMGIGKCLFTFCFLGIHYSC